MTFAAMAHAERGKTSSCPFVYYPAKVASRNLVFQLSIFFLYTWIKDGVLIHIHGLHEFQDPRLGLRARHCSTSALFAFKCLVFF